MVAMRKAKHPPPKRRGVWKIQSCRHFRSFAMFMRAARLLGTVFGWSTGFAPTGLDGPSAFVNAEAADLQIYNVNP
jgi:hypothetical protein